METTEFKLSLISEHAKRNKIVEKAVSTILGCICEQDFFDNVSHDLLMEALKIRVKDSSTLSLIAKFHKWLNRRSQKKKMNWERFYKYLERYPLPKPSIKHNFYTGYPCIREIR